MKTVLAFTAVMLVLFTCSCGTEIGNGDEQKDRPDSEGSTNEGSNPVTEKVGRDEFNAPSGSPYDKLGVSTIPVLGAFINYCQGPAHDLSTSADTFESGELTITAKQLNVNISYPSGYKESVSGTSVENFEVGLPTFSCDSFTQTATTSIPGLDGTFTKKVQILISPEGKKLTVIWYTDEVTGKIARVEMSDNYSALIFKNIAF